MRVCKADILTYVCVCVYLYKTDWYQILTPFLGHVRPLGDWSVLNPSQEDVQKAAIKAVERFNVKSKAKKYFKLVEITSAQMKV